MTTSKGLGKLAETPYITKTTSSTWIKGARTNLQRLRIPLEKRIVLCNMPQGLFWRGFCPYKVVFPKFDSFLPQRLLPHAKIHSQTFSYSVLPISSQFRNDAAGDREHCQFCKSHIAVL
jgi:hypothetical protein